TRDANREESRKRINRWVEEITREKIRDLIEPGVLDANTRMVLTNAMYFNGQWMWPFDKQLTSPSIFHVSSRESIMTDFMHLKKTLSFYEDEEIQAIKLPYRNERISMTIILPRSVEGWEMISRVLDHERLATVESQFESAEVHVSLPKFKSELMLNLKNELSAMGMSLAFSRDADLSGMSGEKNLFIDEVLHKAFIEVSENGTEAAAATAAVIGLKSALREEPARFNADHPFLYLIRDQQTGCIIFIGRLVKP
ncbi:MAG: serpin family protein, partial [Bacteroidales bacterium]|nr:serpin family protein [Bacteroidales bacterium]